MFFCERENHTDHMILEETQNAKATITTVVALALIILPCLPFLAILWLGEKLDLWNRHATVRWK